MYSNEKVNRFKQHGAAAVEFALVASLFFTVLFGAIEMGRVLFYMNTAAEATRLGARLAVVCDVNDTVIKTRMSQMLSILKATNIDVSYDPSGCNRSSCRSITVSIGKSTPLPINTVIPFIPFSINMPPFSTTLPRESMDSASNSVCD